MLNAQNGNKWLNLRCISISTAILVGSSFIGGCAGITYNYYVSSPVTKDDQSFITKGGVIDLDNLRLIVRPAYRIRIGHGSTRYDPSQYELQSKYYDDAVSRHPDFLYVELLIESKKEGVSFDPNDIYLTTMEGKKLLPSKYEGPSDVVSKNNYVRPLCSSESTERIDWMPGFTFKSHKAYCFALRFDTPLRTNMEFSLEINGIQLDGVKIQIPPVMYRTEIIDNYES